MDLIMTRTVTGLAPASDEARDELRGIKLGTVMRCKVHRMRNSAHHRKFFALLNTVWSACDQWPTVESLLTDLKFALRHTEDVLLVSTGEIVRIPKSISFGAMDQTEFDQFYQSALRALCEMAGGIEESALRQAVLEQLEAA